MDPEARLGLSSAQKYPRGSVSGRPRLPGRPYAPFHRSASFALELGKQWPTFVKASRFYGRTRGAFDGFAEGWIAMHSHAAMLKLRMMLLAVALTIFPCPERS